MTAKAFASAGLFALIVDGLRRQGLTVPGGAASLGPRYGAAHVTLAAKRALLDAILAQHGPLALLRVGDAVQRQGFHPLLHTLLQAHDAADLIGRWLRLERYSHSHHRTLVALAPRRATMRHIAINGASPPGAAEDLLIVGVYAGLLEAIGCLGVEVAMPAGRLRHEGAWNGQLAAAAVASGRTGEWTLRWASEPSPAKEARPATLAFDGHSAADRLALLLGADPARAWSVRDAALALALSPRTLQRRLADADLTFIKVQRAVQVKAACEMLSAADAPPLPVIGYACGFSDQSHFTREFARRTGMPPGRYRALLRANPDSG